MFVNEKDNSERQNKHKENDELILHKIGNKEVF